MTDARSYRLVRFTSPHERGFAAAVDIYIRNTVPRVRTDSREIAYWLEHFSEESEDSFYVFGFLLNEKPIGFAMSAYFSDRQFFIIDYVVIDEPYRKHSTFYEFVDQITSFLQAAQPAYRYGVAEICRLSDSDEPSDSSRAMIRLLKMQGFSVIRASYTTPRLGLDEFEAEMRADLLIVGREKLESLHVETYAAIVKTLYFGYFERWYSIYADDAAQYHRYLEELYAAVMRVAPRPRVQINGYKSLMPTSTPPPASHREILGFTARALVCIAVFTAGLFWLKQFLSLSDSSFVSIYLLVLLTVFGIMAVVSRDARLVFYRIATLVREVLSQNNTKLQAKPRSTGTRRKRLSKNDQAKASDTALEKRNRNGDKM